MLQLVHIPVMCYNITYCNVLQVKLQAVMGSPCKQFYHIAIDSIELEPSAAAVPSPNPNYFQNPNHTSHALNPTYASNVLNPSHGNKVTDERSFKFGDDQSLLPFDIFLQNSSSYKCPDLLSQVNDNQLTDRQSRDRTLNDNLRITEDLTSDPTIAGSLRITDGHTRDHRVNVDEMITDERTSDHTIASDLRIADVHTSDYTPLRGPMVTDTQKADDGDSYTPATDCRQAVTDCHTDITYSHQDMADSCADTESSRPVVKERCQDDGGCCRATSESRQDVGHAPSSFCRRGQVSHGEL